MRIDVDQNVAPRLERGSAADGHTFMSAITIVAIVIFWRPIGAQHGRCVTTRSAAALAGNCQQEHLGFIFPRHHCEEAKIILKSERRIFGMSAECGKFPTTPEIPR